MSWTHLERGLKGKSRERNRPLLQMCISSIFVVPTSNCLTATNSGALTSQMASINNATALTIITTETTNALTTPTGSGSGPTGTRSTTLQTTLISPASSLMGFCIHLLASMYRKMTRIPHQMMTIAPLPFPEETIPQMKRWKLSPKTSTAMTMTWSDPTEVSNESRLLITDLEDTRGLLRPHLSQMSDHWILIFNSLLLFYFTY